MGSVLTGGFDVNFMDDVGQTLLNWASAFGKTLRNQLSEHTFLASYSFIIHIY